MQNDEIVGFVGLGAMGLPMTAVLAANGVPMLVYDPADSAQAAARSLSGVEVAGSHGEVAVKAAVLFTCLPNDAIAGSIAQIMHAIGATNKAASNSPPLLI